LAEYYRAADVYLHPTPVDSRYGAVLEAAACQTPSIVFDIGAARSIVEHMQTGFVAAPVQPRAFLQGIIQGVENPSWLAQMGQAAAQRVKQNHSLDKVMADYVALYQEVAAPQASGLGNGESQHEQNLKSIPRIVQMALERGWETVWQECEVRYSQYGKEQKQQQGIFTDAFFRECLQHLNVDSDKAIVWQLAEQWMTKRDIPPRCGHLAAEERAYHVDFCRDLRRYLVRYFAATSLAQFAGLNRNHHNVIVKLWRWCFLNSFSALNLDMESEGFLEAEWQKEENHTGYPRLMIQSMFVPHPTVDININMEKLMNFRLPLSMKAILLLWLTNAPFYSGEEKHRANILKYIHDFCKAAVQKPKEISTGFFQSCIEHFVSSLWRISYIGGNNIQALSAYGDFIAAMMKKDYKKYTLPYNRKNHKISLNRKIRIGYISMNFRSQAVSNYMANRIFYYDKEKFEVYTFILKHIEDDMTEKIKQHSDRSFEFTDFQNIEAIAKQIQDSDLDILIYADIGMDAVTYQLGALRLAPVQCVLVGHGTTTGLPTIDYYISGDFEPENAQQHYREKLIRLPTLGAAQIPPKVVDNGLTRKSLRVPEDAVVFISCANGIKYHWERDHLLINILQQAPNAWIVLKPFQNPPTIDEHLNQRIISLAKKAGVNNRLIMLPPLPKPGDLMGLLKLADVQLDTYPYGGWTTNMEALFVGLPIVTQEGDMARNRWGAAMLRAMGIEAGIARNEEEYVAWAVKFAQNKELRQGISKRITEQVQQVLFNGAEAQKSYELTIEDLCQQAEQQGVKRKQ
jgi:predicted O-linked N-acetylglucosamine transferase (SPINDLY family)